MNGLLQAWENTVRQRGSATAVTQASDGSACTFRELNARAKHWLAAQTSASGTSLAGRAVVFAAPNGTGWLEIFIGLLRAGAVIVPLDAGEPPAAQRLVAASLRAGFWWDGTRLVALAGARRFRSHAPCLIKLTSGSTGRPRPLPFTAAQLLADERQVAATMGLRPRDVNYALIPFGHSYGLGNLTLPLLVRGLPVVCGATPLPHAIAADFVRWQPTVFPSVPAVWNALAASEVPPADLASLRLAISAGAPLPPEVARRYAARFGRRLHNFYGSSETGGIAYDRTGSATLAGGVGQPLRGVTIAMIRGERIAVSSAAVFTLGNRRARGRFGRWTPADRATIDHRGFVTLLGRRGVIVKIAGRRVNLGEVTSRLRQVAGVREAWVDIGPGPNPALGAALATERSIAELRAELQADTASWKIPKKWTVLPSLPLTARGKVDTRELRARVFG